MKRRQAIAALDSAAAAWIAKAFDRMVESNTPSDGKEFEQELSIIADAFDAAHRVIAALPFDPDAEPEPEPVAPDESDEAFRKRILCECGAGSVNYNRVLTATGADLDTIGSFYDLERGKPKRKAG